jgi:MoaA/NifB/PqqE/SkfB family radical SAM enzyme
MYKVENRWPHYYDSCKIEWNLGKRCNLDCTYCPSEIHDYTSPHTDINILKKTIDVISTIPNARVSLTGGEPCVHPKILELLYYLRKKVGWINLTTNATRSHEFYLELPVDHIVFSLHFEHPKWETRLNNIIKFVRDNRNSTDAPNIKYHINIMAHHDYMSRARNAVETLSFFKANYTVRRIRWTEKHDWFDDLKYKPEDLQWLIDTETTADFNTLIDSRTLTHTNDLLKENKNKFEGWSCRAGIESLMINWDGDVHRATCRVGGSLGNIYNGTFDIPTEPITCTRKWCTCAADVNITKWKK